MELYLNITGNLQLTAYKPGVVQLGISAANITSPSKPVIGGINSGDVPVQVVAVETDEGYRIEAAVPLVTDVWKVVPISLGKVGFQVHLNSATGDDRDTKLIWSSRDTKDESDINPSLFGQLIFWRNRRAN